MPNCRTDRQTDKSDFIGTSVGQVSKKQIWKSAILLGREKIIVNQTILKWLYRKENCKGSIEFPLVFKKVRPPWHLVQISILKGGLGILDIDTQLNSLKTKWIQRLLNPTNAFSKDLMLYRLNLSLIPNKT